MGGRLLQYATGQPCGMSYDQLRAYVRKFKTVSYQKHLVQFHRNMRDVFGYLSGCHLQLKAISWNLDP